MLINFTSFYIYFLPLPTILAISLLYIIYLFFFSYMNFLYIFLLFAYKFCYCLQFQLKYTNFVCEIAIIFATNKICLGELKKKNFCSFTILSISFFLSFSPLLSLDGFVQHPVQYMDIIIIHHCASNYNLQLPSHNRLLITHRAPRGPYSTDWV